MRAVIVSPDVGYGHGDGGLSGGGYYANPYYGYQPGWHPDNPGYDPPYTQAEITDLLSYACRK